MFTRHNRQLNRMILAGFKSIKHCDLQLRNLNVLIGCNGAGKSNFISFFRMIQQMLDGKLQAYVSKQGGPDSLLHFGRKTTSSIRAEIYFGESEYKFRLEPTHDNRMMYADEESCWCGESESSSGHFETLFKSRKQGRWYDDTVRSTIKSWRLYHFHDTSENAQVKQVHGINDNGYLRSDAQNLAAFLFLIKNTQEAHYQRIVKTVRLVAPFFGDFYLRPQPGNKDKIELEWTEAGQDIPFKAHELSDGTLRFICLAAALLQPHGFMPETLLIDEPELGLHPYAIRVLAAMMKTASQSAQVIVSTQSVELLNEFTPEDVIVADRNGNQSEFRRLKTDELQKWLDEDYSLGDLWKKNVIGGRPAR